MLILSYTLYVVAFTQTLDTALVPYDCEKSFMKIMSYYWPKSLVPTPVTFDSPLKSYIPLTWKILQHEIRCLSLDAVSWSFGHTF